MTQSTWGALWSRGCFGPLFPLLPSCISVNLQVCLYTKPGTWKACFYVDFFCRPVIPQHWETSSLLTARARFPGAAIEHVLLQISGVSVTRERGDGGGRVGFEGLLAPRRLGAAWHWAQLLPARPAVFIIGCPLLPLPSGWALDIKALVMGVS